MHHKRRIYIAGPMRGIRDFNFQAFHAAAHKLRAKGYEVYNPAEEEEKKYGVGFARSETGNLADINPAWGFNFREAYALNVAWIALYAEAIACLPGWEGAKGAVGEIGVARALSLEVLNYPDLKPICT